MMREAQHEPRDPLSFTPVPRRKARSDGWTAERQRQFIEVLAATGSVRTACDAVGLQFTGAYKLRNAAGAESFARAWDAAVLQGADAVRDILIDHSLNGVPEPVYHAGRLVGERRRFNHRSMMWVIENGNKRRAEPPPRSPEEERAQRKREHEEFLAAMAELEAIIRDGFKRRCAIIAGSPEHRAAYECLYGPVDWNNLDLSVAPWDAWYDAAGESVPGPPNIIRHPYGPSGPSSMRDIHVLQGAPGVYGEEEF